MGLSFTIAAGPRQRSHSQVRVPRDSWLHLTVRFESPLTWRARPIYIPQEQGGPVKPQGTGFPSRRLLRLASLRWRYLTPPALGIYPYSILSYGLGSSLYSLGADPTQNSTFNSSSIVVGVFTNPLPRSGRLLIRLLHSNDCTPCLFKLFA
jgi:hypothetical protein